MGEEKQQQQQQQPAQPQPPREQSGGGDSSGGGSSKPYSRPLEIPEEELGKEHRFWDRQPVPSVRDGDSESCGPIDSSNDLSKIRKNPLTLPDGYEWIDIDVSNHDQLAQVHDLLKNHYVEDTGACFRFDYSMPCLRWALMAEDASEAKPDTEEGAAPPPPKATSPAPPPPEPTSKPETLKPETLNPHTLAPWSIGIMAVMKSVSDPSISSKKLVAYISGIRVQANVHGNSMKAAEINFLCIHKSLRSKRLAPVLIKEITRRINLDNIWQAIYTAGVFIPRPVTDCRYFHRPLNLAKLISIGFSSLKPGQTLKTAEAELALPDHFTVDGIRKMTKADIPQVLKIMNDSYERDGIKLFIELNEQEAAHWLLPREGVVESFVREVKSQGEGEASASPSAAGAAEASGSVTDFFTYYLLPSTVLRFATEYKTIEVAYCFHSAGMTLSRTQLLEQTIIAAKIAKVDVVNALNLQGNFNAFHQLKFGPGDGSLKYYLYNYKCPIITPDQNAVILL